MQKFFQLAQEIANKYSKSPDVLAVVLGGSQTTDDNDSMSDIDLYVYSEQILSIEFRSSIASDHSSKIEINNIFWEPGDEWMDNETEIKVDVMFRTKEWIEDQLNKVLNLHEASIGYSTCFWDNILKSIILFDKHGWFKQLQESSKRNYPLALKKSIIKNNFPILTENNSCYLNQLRAAVKRNDAISIVHRITAFLASYFDVLFAINEETHPGEKRLLDHVQKKCSKIPNDFESLITQLLSVLSSYDSRILDLTTQLGKNLKELLKQEQYFDSLYNQK